MKSALLGGLCGGVVASVVLLAGGALGDDDPAPAAPAKAPAVQQSRGAAADTDVGRIYQQASPATVSVLTEDGGGTGFLVDREGTVVTNAHVVGTGDDVTIRFGPDGDRLDGEVQGSDPGSDLAIVRLKPADVPRDVRPLELADSDRVGVGEAAIAIGNPFGLPRTATVGIVSAVGRTIQAPNGFSIPGAIQTDAAINPGNSGGPLLDGRGRVIGVNSQIETTGGGNVGIGFAVPSNTVREVVPDLRDDGRVRRGFLGVSTENGRNANGARVAALVEGGPADDAGLRVGDVITAFGGEPVRDSDDVVAAVSARRAGDAVEVTVRRAGAERKLRVELGTQPRRRAAAPRSPSPSPLPVPPPGRPPGR